MLFKNQKGQTIVAVFVIMVVALSVGVAISSRFLKGLKMATRTDSSSRAYAVAEAAVEKVLKIPYDSLVEYINFGNCGADCYLELLGEDGITAVADVALSIVGDSSVPYLVSLRKGEVVEVNLDGYGSSSSIYVCWNHPLSGDRPSIWAIHLFGTVGSYEADTYAYNSVGTVYGDNGFSDAAASLGYDSCFTVLGKSNPIGLRLRVFYNDAEVYIVPTGGENIPSQGILISSTGVFDDVQRKVEVVMGNPFLPAPFDFALFQKSTTLPLSN